MLVRFHNEVVNINNVEEFYIYSDDVSDKEFSYGIKFDFLSDRFIAFEFKAQKHRDKMFNEILKAYSNGFRFLDLTDE